MSPGPGEDGGTGWTKMEDRNGRLAPQPCVVAVQAGTQRPARHKQLGAGVVVAVRVDRVGEGMDVREVTPPRLVVILKPKQRLAAGGAAAAG